MYVLSASSVRIFRGDAPNCNELFFVQPYAKRALRVPSKTDREIQLCGR
jgi:hypothetical protein